MQDPILALKHLDRIQRKKRELKSNVTITSKLSDLNHSSNHTQEEKIENKKGFTYYGQAPGSWK
jgi:hypothetical protein